MIVAALGAHLIDADVRMYGLGAFGNREVEMPPWRMLVVKLSWRRGRLQ